MSRYHFYFNMTVDNEVYNFLPGGHVWVSDGV